MRIGYKAKVAYTWLHLRNRIYVSKCFRMDSPGMICNYFGYLELEDYQIKRITDDLFLMEHLNDTRVNTFNWNSDTMMNASIEKMVASQIAFPSYFIDNVVDTFIKNIGQYDPYSYRNSTYKELCLQPNISADSLVRQINWLGDSEDKISLYENYHRNDDIDSSPIKLLFNHPNITPESLLILASSKNAIVRDNAVKHPLCPREALIARSLMANSEGVDWLSNTN